MFEHLTSFLFKICLFFYAYKHLSCRYVCAPHVCQRGQGRRTPWDCTTYPWALGIKPRPSLSPALSFKVVGGVRAWRGLELQVGPCQSKSLAGSGTHACRGAVVTLALALAWESFSRSPLNEEYGLSLWFWCRIADDLLRLWSCIFSTERMSKSSD